MMRDIDQAIEIAAPVERVWQVMTSPGMIDEWLGCLDFKAEIGHLFYMQPDAAKRSVGDVSGATHCQLLRLDPRSEMAFSWFYPDSPKTEVSIRLSPTPGGTRVELTHAGWDQFDEQEIRAIREALANGWKSFVLPQLKRLAERDDPA